jgi:DNA-binding HxlR family transcriptional regulator
VSNRAYGQYCGFARALEAVGERWALLIVRDLLIGPKRFSDLHRGLPGIPTNVLTTRLKELEDAGIVVRRALPHPERATVYELTEYGNELENVVFELGRWGAKSLGDPRPNETITTDSILTAMRTTFQPAAARGVKASYELRMGPVVVSVRVERGKLTSAPGPLEDADLIIESGPALRGLMAREMTPAEAIKNGSVKITGDRRFLNQFVDMFRI